MDKQCSYCVCDCDKTCVYEIQEKAYQQGRADGAREFAEWLEKKDLLTLWHGDDDNETLSAEKVLNMYGKEQIC